MTTIQAYTKIQIGITSVAAAVGVARGAQTMATVATLGAVATFAIPSLLCMGGAILASGISLLANVLADRGKISNKTALIVALSASILAIVIRPLA